MTTFDYLILARALHFVTIYVLFGSTFFWIYMGGHRLPRTQHTTAILLRVAAPIAAISGIAWLLGILANMLGGFDDALNFEPLRLFFFETQFGPVAIVRLMLLLIAVVVSVRSHIAFRALPWVAALLLLSQAWLGHAVEGGATLYGAAMIFSYGVHMLAASAWVGGLPPLLFALNEHRHATPEESRQWTLDILSRYSLMAIVAVTLIVLSGIANAVFRVAGSFDKLYWTAYGLVLSEKILAVVVMLALAYFNRFVAMPRLRNAALKDDRQIVRLRASVAFELVLGVVVLCIAAVLGVTPPPQ